ncbi:MAG TPA: hypothetical protein VFN40_00060 [Gemmatimonadales bacterium]|nr:hypothetical protein [Gemmatimonadales bacterium]
MLWNHAVRRALRPALLAVCGTLGLSACGAHYAQVPARLSLQPYGRVALVTFSTEQANHDLTALTTQRFAEALLASQSGFELLELSSADSTLQKLSANGDAAALAQAIGREKHVPAVFLGHVTASGVTPRGRLSATGGLSMKATVSAELTVRLVSTSTGGTLWRSSSAANGTVGRVGVSGALPSVAVRDPNEAYGEMVGELVQGVTRDLRPTWVKQ